MICNKKKLSTQDVMKRKDYKFVKPEHRLLSQLETAYMNFFDAKDTFIQAKDEFMAHIQQKYKDHEKVKQSMKEMDTESSKQTSTNKSCPGTQPSKTTESNCLDLIQTKAFELESSLDKDRCPGMNNKMNHVDCSGTPSSGGTSPNTTSTNKTGGNINEPEKNIPSTPEMDRAIKDMFHRIARQTHPDKNTTFSDEDIFRMSKEAMKQKKMGKLLFLAKYSGIPMTDLIQDDEIRKHIHNVIAKKTKKIEKYSKTLPVMWKDANEAMRERIEQVFIGAL